MPRTAAFLIMLILSLPFCQADELHLKDGMIVEGVITETPEGYTVSVGSGANTFISKDKVIRLVKKLTDEQKYENLKLVCPADDFEAQMKLGLWARLHNLPEQAKEHFENAVKLKPDDPKARRAAGYIFKNQQWYKPDEYMKSLGKLKYNGKWLDKAEAEKLINQDRLNEMRQKGNRETWLLLSRASKAKSQAELEEITDSIKKLGEYAVGAVIRGAYDTNQKVREVSLRVLAVSPGEDPLEALLKCFRYERTKKNVLIITKALADRSDRENVIKQLVKINMTTKSPITRKRCWLAYRVIADNKIIEELIKLSEFCPVPKEMQANEEEKKDTGGGWVTHKGERDKMQKAFYPATDSLNYLTDARLSHFRNLWEEWWKTNKETFKIKPVTLSEEKEN